MLSQAGELNLNLTFDIVHLRRGDHWVVRTVWLAVLAVALRVGVQHQAWRTTNKTWAVGTLDRSIVGMAI